MWVGIHGDVLGSECISGFLATEFTESIEGGVGVWVNIPLDPPSEGGLKWGTTRGDR